MELLLSLPSSISPRSLTVIKQWVLLKSNKWNGCLRGSFFHIAERRSIQKATQRVSACCLRCLKLSLHQALSVATFEMCSSNPYRPAKFIFIIKIFRIFLVPLANPLKYLKEETIMLFYILKKDGLSSWLEQNEFG